MMMVVMKNWRWKKERKEGKDDDRERGERDSYFQMTPFNAIITSQNMYKTQRRQREMHEDNTQDKTGASELFVWRQRPPT